MKNINYFKQHRCGIFKITCIVLKKWAREKERESHYRRSWAWRQIKNSHLTFFSLLLLFACFFSIDHHSLEAFTRVKWVKKSMCFWEALKTSSNVPQNVYIRTWCNILLKKAADKIYRFCAIFSLVLFFTMCKLLKIHFVKATRRTTHTTAIIRHA